MHLWFLQQGRKLVIFIITIAHQDKLLLQSVKELTKHFTITTALAHTVPSLLNYCKSNYSKWRPVSSYSVSEPSTSPHLLTRNPPIHRNLQANQRRRGQKYSKWNCWNSGVLRMSLRKAMSKSDSVSMMRSSRRAKSSPMVTKNRRNTLRTNLFSSSTSLGGDGLLLTIRSALLPLPPSAACPSFDVPASPSFCSSMLQVEPLRWRAKGISWPCSATGVGSTLSEGLYASSEMTADVLASLPSTIWPREGMKESPWETERTGVEWALSRRDSRPEHTEQRKTTHEGDTIFTADSLLGCQNIQINRKTDRVKDNAQECGPLVAPLTSPTPAVGCDIRCMAADSRSYLQPQIVLPSLRLTANSLTVTVLIKSHGLQESEESNPPNHSPPHLYHREHFSSCQVDEQSLYKLQFDF
ncbi:hypothetical protein INR49_016276 [Caranx melampygus]|nr:hypothetical protein INR49_016276 [Caranx melampygus]